MLMCYRPELNTDRQPEFEVSVHQIRVRLSTGSGYQRISENSWIVFTRKQTRPWLFPEYQVLSEWSNTARRDRVESWIETYLSLLLENIYSTVQLAGQYFTQGILPATSNSTCAVENWDLGLQRAGGQVLKGEASVKTQHIVKDPTSGVLLRIRSHIHSIKGGKV